MFTMNELLSKRNQKQVLVYFASKKDSECADGIRVSEFESYWQLNHEQIENELRTGEYMPAVIKTYEIVNGKGKKRFIRYFCASK